MSQKKEIKDIYFLTPMQEGMLFSDLLSGKNDAYFQQIHFSINGELNIQAVQKAIDFLVSKYDILRTIFVYKNSKRPVQVVLKEKKINLNYQDVSNLQQGENKKFIEKFKDDDRNKGFDLLKESPLRVNILRSDSRCYEAIISFHHIILDGWSLGNLLSDFKKIYEHVLLGKEYIEDEINQFSSYIKWIEEQDKKEALDYWEKYLMNYEQVAAVPKIKQAVQAFEYIAEQQFYDFDISLANGLENISRKNGVTLSTVLHTIWGILLNKYNNVNDSIFASVVSGRPSDMPGIEKMVGMFINSVPYRVKYEENMTFTDVLAQVWEKSKNSNRYDYAPLSEIQAKSTLKNNLIDHAMVFENYPLSEKVVYQKDTSLGFNIENISIYGHPNYDFNIVITPKTDAISIKISYNANIYDREYVMNITERFESICRSIVENPNITIRDIEIVDGGEKKKLLFDFNNTSEVFASNQVIYKAFEEVVKKKGGNIAIVSKDNIISYSELNSKSNQLARKLREMGIGNGSIVAIMVEPSMETILGIIAVLKAGATYLPIDYTYPLDRVKFILQDSKAQILLVNNYINDSLRDQIDVVNISEDYLYKGTNDNLNIEVDIDDVAYIIYTSGTTGTPKGVKISNRNILNYVCWFKKKVTLSDKDRTVILSSLAFDLSYTSLYSALLTGSEVNIIFKEVYSDPDKLLKYIKENKITFIKGTPSLFSTLVNCKSFLDRKVCESIRLIVLGGEEINALDIENFNKVYPSTQIMNHYGPTECTIGTIATFINFDELDYYKNKPYIGKPISNARAYILDVNKKIKPIGSIGELYIAGTGLALGYLNNEDLTKERFIDNPYIPNEKIYRTGDLVRWLSDGNIEFIGRIDNQVKIRGFRVEIGEIKNQLLKHESIKEAAILDRKDKSGNKYLCGYLVTDNELNIENIRKFLSKTLPDYMIPSYFIKVDKIPLTANGKIDKKLLLTQENKTILGTEYEAPRNVQEEKLVKLWTQLLGVEQIGVNNSFFELGGHSLKAITLVSSIYKEFGVEVPLKVLFAHPTIKGIVEFIKGADSKNKLMISSVHKKEHYVVSSAQMRTYTLCQYDKDNINYNMPSAMIIEGNLELDKLNNAFEKLILRHEAFRTYFEVLDGEVVQKIQDNGNAKLEYNNLVGKDEVFIQKFLKDLIKPFELSKAPLIRASIIKKTENKYILFTDMHHIISDGVSISIFFKELFELYNDKVLNGIKLQYKDFAQWQQEFRNTEEFRKYEEFWLNHLSGELPVTNLPIDYQRQNIRSFEGDYINFSIAGDDFRKLRNIASENGTTTYMVLYSIYCVLLSRYSSQEEIIIGSVSAGRNQHEFEDIIGMFVNTLAIRSYPQGDKSFRNFLREIKDTFLEAFDNQNYQFEEILDKLKIKTDASRNPLFDTLFAYENNSDFEIKLDRFTINPMQLEYKVSKFDLALMSEEKLDKVDFRFEYNCNLFKRKTIERLKSSFMILFNDITKNLDKALSEFRILSDEEKELLLYKFNETETEFPSEKTIHGIFEEQVEKKPDNIAISFNGIKMTYRELNAKANSIGKLLRDKGVKRNDIVAIMVDRSPEMIIGALGVIKAGGAYMPIDPNFPRERIEYMLQDSNTCGLLTSKELADSVEFNGYKINLDEDKLYNLDDANLNIINSSNDLLYIIYTSGTTGRPKGVMIEHRNLVRLFFNDKNLFDFNEKDTWTMFHSFCFDFSVWEMYGALLYGGKLVIVPKILAQDTRAYLQLLRDESVTILNQTPTAFYNLVKEELQEIEKKLCIRYVIFGGEALSPSRLKDWKLRYQDTKLINMYGITETTVHVTYKEITDYEIEMNISNIGAPIPTLKTYVFDKNMNLLPIGVPGELCVAGHGVGRGYLNRSELTSEKFVINQHVKGERIYKSGDLVKWLPDGEMEYLGRIDHQVKVRGYRIELGEIEKHLLNNKDISDVIVVYKEDNSGEKYICAYFVAKRDMRVAELREYMAEELPDYMVPSYFIQIDHIPVTINGKIDKKALPDIDSSIYMGEEYEAPRNKLEEEIDELWKLVLGIDKIGIKDNFFELGGHSLKAMSLASMLSKKFEVEITLREFFEITNIEKQAEFIRKSKKRLNDDIKKIREKDYYLASSAQRRIFALSQFGDNNVNYNVPTIISIEGELSKEKLDNAFKKVIDRHEALRTTFEYADDTLVQRIHQTIKFELEYEKLESGCEAVIGSEIARYIRNFDLINGPLIRGKVFEIDKFRYLLAVDMHHIICDGISKNIFLKDLFDLYSGKNMCEIDLQYKDFAEWQDEMYKLGKMKSHEDYWMNQFKEEIPVLNIPTDYKRPSVQSFEGDYLEFFVNKEVSAKLKKIAVESECTLNTVLLAAYNVLLSKYSLQDDIIVGAVTSGRTSHALRNTMGMFVNTLALRNNPSSNKSFREFLREVRNNLLDAVDNQEYPFEKIIEKLDLRRDISRNPLFDTVFTLENSELHEINVEGIAIKPEEIDYKTAKFDLAVVAEDKTDNIRIIINYCTKLFKRDSIKRLSRHFEYILNQIDDKIDCNISEIELTDSEEKEKILVDFNKTASEYPRNKSITTLFEEQVGRMPENIAVVEGDISLTYEDLNKKANQLARKLIEAGVTNERIVGIMVQAGIEFIIGILGILKAGGAYMPIDPEYPTDRVKFMINDSGISTLVTKKNLDDGLNFAGNIIYIDDEKNNANNSHNLEYKSSTQDLAYVIYTSGSTGRPKGVMIEHISLVNLCYWHNKQYEITYQDRCIKYAGVGFDASVWEIFPYLICGSSIYIVQDDLRFNVNKLNEYFEKNKITITFLPTQICEQFIGRDNKSLRILLTGGDKLKKFVKERYKLYNNYGPTENTVVTTFFYIDKFYDNIPIGRPISNNKIFIVDRFGKLLPVGVPGELCVAGDGIARGYLNNSELTSQKFVPNIYDGSGLMYRTGDLARWTEDGNIEFLGRVDKQVKIRGNRIEIGEIESQLLKNKSIKDAVVICREDINENKYLCAYVVSDKPIKSLELKRELSKELPQYMIPAYFVQIDNIPLNANGKIDTKILENIDVNISKVNEFEPPRNEIEEKMVYIWSSVLNAERVGVNDNFFELGGDSLKAMLLISKVQKEFNTKIEIVDVFREATVRQLSDRLISESHNTIAKIKKAEGLKGFPYGCYPLSSAQKRMFVLSRMESSGITYNTPFAYKIFGKLDLAKLEDSFNTIIQRHEILRTSFQIINNIPVQRVHDDVYFKPEVIETNEADIDDVIRSAIKPFDLTSCPLFRVNVLKVQNYQILLIDMPHIISDGVSAGIIMKEFAALYEGNTLEVPLIQYKDFASWQAEMLNSGNLKKQEEFWINKLSEQTSRFEIPTDYPRASVNTFEGITKIYEIDERLSLQIKELTVRSNTTLFITLFAAYNVLLHKYTGSEDVIVGCGIAGRHHPGTDEIVGMFVNTLAMKNSVKNNMTFKELLSEIKENSIEAYKNQDYPFDLLVEKMGLQRESGRNPIFDTLFELQESENSKINISGLEVENFYIQSKIAKFDFAIFVLEENNKIQLYINYNTQLFNSNTIDNLFTNYEIILKRITENSNVHIKGIKLSGEDEYIKLENVMDKDINFNF